MEAVRVVRSRGELTEAVHAVRVAVWRCGSATDWGAETGPAAEARVLLRSAAKPVQALAAIVTGAAERFEFGPRELAVACGSHSGEPMHVELARDVLRRAGLAASALLCGAHAPVHEPSAHALVRADQAPTALHNNCSGKHAAMLAACVAAGWETADYIAPEHPLQLRNRAHVAAFAGVPSASVHLGTDGCSVPVFGVPLTGAARMFALVADPRAGGPHVGVDDELLRAAGRIGRAMRVAPELVGGTGRSDTDLMRASAGTVISKVGAEGLWCIGVAERGMGIAVKSTDGSSDAARRVGLALLRAAGLLDDAAWAALHAHHDPIVRNHRQLDVGRIRVDVPAALTETLS